MEALVVKLDVSPDSNPQEESTEGKKGCRIISIINKHMCDMLMPLNSHRHEEKPIIYIEQDFLNWFFIFCCSTLPIRWAAGGALGLPGYSEAPGVAGRWSQRVRRLRQHGEDKSRGRKTLRAVLHPLQVSSCFVLVFFFISLQWVCFRWITCVSLLCPAGDSLQSSSRAAVWRRLSCTRCSSTHCSPVSPTHQGQRHFSGLINVIKAAECC